MDRYLITRRSHNQRLGPIMVTTSARTTCPHHCPLSRDAFGSFRGTCYAEHGFIGGYLWPALDRARRASRNSRIKVHTFDALLSAIRSLQKGAMWRHNQAGDLASDDQITINREKLQALTLANKGRRGFTFTHYPVVNNLANREAVKEANGGGFAVNVSANSLSHADELADLEIGPVVTLLPAGTTANTKTPKGRTVAVCPAVTTKHVTCASCGICTKQRKAIIGFPMIGRQRAKRIPADPA